MIFIKDNHHECFIIITYTHMCHDAQNRKGGKHFLKNKMKSSDRKNKVHKTNISCET